MDYHVELRNFTFEGAIVPKMSKNYISAPESRRDLSDGSFERSLDGLSLETTKLHFRRPIVAEMCPKWPKVTSKLLKVVETCSRAHLMCNFKPF